MVKKHKSARKCPICKQDHTLNQHRSHKTDKNPSPYKKMHKGKR